MPTYDYICDSCAHEFEAFESIKSDPQKTCPSCSRDSLRRKIGPGAAILFKGSGFYQTDYRSASYKAGAKADKGPDSAPAAKSDGGSKSDGGGSSSTSPPPAPAKPAAPSGGD